MYRGWRASRKWTPRHPRQSRLKGESVSEGGFACGEPQKVSLTILLLKSVVRFTIFAISALAFSILTATLSIIVLHLVVNWRANRFDIAIHGPELRISSWGSKT